MGLGVNRGAACSGDGGACAGSRVSAQTRRTSERLPVPRPASPAVLTCPRVGRRQGAATGEALRLPSRPVCSLCPQNTPIPGPSLTCGGLEESLYLSNRTRCKPSFRKKREHLTRPSVETSRCAERGGLRRAPPGRSLGGGKKNRTRERPTQPQRDITAPQNSAAMTESGPQGEGGTGRTSGGTAPFSSEKQLCGCFRPKGQEEKVIVRVCSRLAQPETKNGEGGRDGGEVGGGGQGGLLLACPLGMFCLVGLRGFLPLPWRQETTAWPPSESQTLTDNIVSPGGWPPPPPHPHPRAAFQGAGPLRRGMTRTAFF